MKKFILIFLLLASHHSYAAYAYFTWNYEPAITEALQNGYRCEYDYGGHLMWITYTNLCPMYIEVEFPKEIKDEQ